MYRSLHARALTVAVLFACALFVSLPTSTSSQSVAPFASDGFCGSNVTPEEAARYLESLGRPAPQVPEGTSAPPYCIPIAAHIVRTSAGTGGMSLSQLTQAVADVNLHYANMDMTFYTLLIDYIDDDFFYSNISTIGDIDALRSTNVVNAAINIYFTPNLPGLCGISSFTFSAVQGIVMANGCTGTPTYPSVVSHEIGHYLDLYHTHETAFGVEYVNGTNCTIAGDLFCDTPADPNLGGKVNSSCIYVAGETDPNGDPYAPDVSQIMSYARAVCADTFSPQSENKAVNVLLTGRTVLLQRGCDPAADATISAATPPQGYQDATQDLVIVGTNLRSYTGVFMGPDIAVTTIDTLSTDDSLLVNIVIDTEATAGLVDIIVTNGPSADTLSAGFEVLATLRHYASPTGGNVYPYASPVDAALSLADAVNAAIDGDSVLVDSAAVFVATVHAQRSIAMSGGWYNGFTARDIVTKKTTINLVNNILLSGTAGTTTVDGFVLQGGRGISGSGPVAGDYGGALSINGATAVITNCEIRNNEGTDGLGFGGGGGIYATGANVTISNCHIHSNDATRGGSIFLYQSSGSVIGNTLENNAVAAGGSSNPEGAGVAIQECTSLTLTNNVIRSNTGAMNGGGVWVTNSSGVTVDGGEVRNHSVTNDGGGFLISASAVTVDGTEIAYNTGGFFGGGVAAKDVSTLTLRECRILWNTGLLGGAVMANAGTANIQHNLMVGNIAMVSGGGAYLSTVAGGEIIGNTIDRAAGASGVGGLFLANSPVTVLNNIIVNSTGDGISCSAGPPIVSHNLVWNSSGTDYVGCTPGTGAVSADPLFADTSMTDYRLTLHSPAIDAGDPAPAYDDPDGSRGDMGHYGSHAFTMDQPSYPKNVITDIAAGQLTISWDKNPEGDVDYYAVYCDTVSGFVPSVATLAATTTGADTSVTLPAPSDTTYYRVNAIDTTTYAGGYSDEALSEGGTASGVADAAPVKYSLSQNVPNPFNPTTTIRFSLEKSGRVDLAIYDVAGRLVRELVKGHREAKVYTLTWDGTNDHGQQVSSGIYFYRLTAGGFAQTKKMVLLK